LVIIFFIVSSSSWCVLHTGAPVDVWAMGVVLYTLLCGHLPFGGTGLATNYDVSDESMLYRSVKETILLGEVEISENLSEPAKSLLTSMLCADPEQRISSSAIFTHPWMEHTMGEDEDLPNAGDALNMSGRGVSASVSSKSYMSIGDSLDSELNGSRRGQSSSSSSRRQSVQPGQQNQSRKASNSLSYFANVAKSAKETMSRMKGSVTSSLISTDLLLYNTSFTSSNHCTQYCTALHCTYSLFHISLL
jgi:serine/threonine protein kinase